MRLGKHLDSNFTTARFRHPNLNIHNSIYSSGPFCSRAVGCFAEIIEDQAWHFLSEPCWWGLMMLTALALFTCPHPLTLSGTLVQTGGASITSFPSKRASIASAMFNADASFCPVALRGCYKHGSRLNCRRPGRLLCL